MQNRWMRSGARTAAACALVWWGLAGMAAAGDGGATLVVADDGGFEAPVVRAMRALTLTSLAEHGVPVVHDGPADGSAGAGSRRFVLRIGGQLEQKVPLSLEETETDGGRTLFSASLVATGLDEADRVIPRLVEAVLARRPVGEAARLDTVTAVEATPPLKRSGEGRWIVGFSAGNLGMAVGWMHETRNFRLGPMIEVYPDPSPGGDPNQYGQSGRAYAGINGLWLPRDGRFSPYLGGGLGVVGHYVDENTETDEVGAKIEGGLECFRLNRIRLLVGADVTLSPSRSWSAVHMRMAF